MKRSRGALLGLAALALFASADTDRITAAGSDTRVIAFKHIHTNETLSILYKKDGHYLPEALEKINWIMRDWRKNQVQKIDPAVIDLLWEMHTELGSAEPISIICGFRSNETNEMLRRTVGGQASQSQHITGKAIDVTFPDVPLKKIRYAALVRERGGVGYYPTSGIPFVHVDTSRPRYWPRLPRYELALLFPDGQSKYMPADGGPITKDDVRVAQQRHKDLATQIAAFFDNRKLSHTPMLVADAGGRIRSSGRTEVASLAEAPPQPAQRQPAATKVAALPPEPPAPRLVDAPRLIERSSRLAPGPAVAANATAAKPAPKAVAPAALALAAPAQPVPAPAATARPQPAKLAAAPAGPSQDDRSKLDELVNLASYEPKLVAEPRPAHRPAFASASLTGSPPPAPPAPVTAAPSPAPLPRVAALEPARAPQSIDQVLTDAGFSSGWVPAPAYDEEHPEELSYRPFPVAPLMTASASADDPVLAHMSHPDVARTIDYINDDGEIPPMRFRPGQQTAQVMWAQQFQGEIVSLSTMMARETESAAGTRGVADRRVLTSSR